MGKLLFLPFASAFAAILMRDSLIPGQNAISEPSANLDVATVARVDTYRCVNEHGEEPDLIEQVDSQKRPDKLPMFIVLIC